MSRRVVAIVQARMGSTRLPGKVLLEVHGRALLGRLLDRLRRATTLDAIVVATSTNPSDDAIARFCGAEGVAVFRGSESDVLARFFDAADAHGADVIVRVSADSPLIDPKVVDHLVTEFLKSPSLDYLSNTLAQTYPLGMNAEVFTAEALRRAHAEAVLPYDREHVTPYLYFNRDRFTVREVHLDRDASGIRLTVDEPADLALVTAVLGRLDQQPAFTLEDLLGLFEREPALREINAHVRQTPQRRNAPTA